MGLLAPWFLAGLAAIGLPIWLHLLQQHRVDPLKFPSLQFFERRTETSVRQRRLKFKFLMALRILMLALLAFLFAQPFIRKHIAGAPETRHVLLVLDNSFSMRSGNHLEQAKTEALSVADGLKPGTSAQVIALGGGANLITQPTTDKAELRSAIQSIQPTDSRSAFAEIPRAVRVIAETRKLPVEVHLFSDFQRSSMPPSFQEVSLPTGTVFVSHELARQQTPNFAVESVNAPTVIADPKAVRLTATVVGLGTEEAQRSVSLAINGKTLQSKTLKVPAGGRATVEFIGLDAPYGWNRGEMRVDGGDALPGDDVMRFAVERADPRKVLFLHEAGRTRSALYFRSALEAAAEGLFSLEPMSVDQAAGVDPARFAFVVLSDVGAIPAGLEASLKKYVAAGGGVWIAAGAMTAAHGAVPLSGAKITETRYASRSAERFFSPANLDIAHPSVARANRWEGVRFYQTTSIDPRTASVIVRLNDGTPLLLDERSGEGRIITFASGFENLSNDFPLHTSFVPFVEQTGRYLAQVETSQTAVPVDSFVELRQSGTKAAAALEVMDPRGKRLLDLKTSASAQTLRVTEEGFYAINRQNGRHELVAVNADRAESDLSPMSAEMLDLWKKTGDPPSGPGGVTADQERPASLWWYVALLLLIATLVESFVASRHLEPESAAS